MQTQTKGILILGDPRSAMSLSGAALILLAVAILTIWPKHINNLIQVHKQP